MTDAGLAELEFEVQSTLAIVRRLELEMESLRAELHVLRERHDKLSEEHAKCFGTLP